MKYTSNYKGIKSSSALDTDIQNTFETYPLIIACYLICTVSFAFLLRYLVDSIMHTLGFSDLSGFEKLIFEILPAKDKLPEGYAQKVREQVAAYDIGDQCAITLTEQEMDEILMQI